MPRRASPLKCSAEDKALLIGIRKNRTEDTRVVERAKIILARLNGKEIRQVARDLKVSVPTVTRWCKRFAVKGISGLKDYPRPGKPARYDNAFRQSVLELLTHDPPEGCATWEGRTLAAQLGATVDAVWRVLRREGIYLHRRRNWRIPTDAGFAPQNTDIVGLYLLPPLNALILIAGEAQTFKAKEGLSGFVETESGAVARKLRRAHRHQDALTLAGAIEAGGDQYHGPLTEQQRWEDFKKFLKDVIATQPPGVAIQAILDCGPRDREWLKSLQGRIQYHFTPTSAHWFNLLQILFSLLRVEKAKSDDKAEERLRSAIEAFIRDDNGQTKLFRWRKGEIHYEKPEI